MKLAREAWPILGLALAVAALAAWWWGPWGAALPLAFALFAAWFFRDPERVAPGEPGALIAPADGKIIQAGPSTISIFMNVFDVHVCRAPAAGRVSAVEHQPGRFVSAFKEAAPEVNERARISLARADGPLSFTLIAGLVARRIVCKVRPGQELAAGERVGLIQFGSRVDVAVPEGLEVAVRVGARVRAGETVIARPRRGR